MSISDPAQQREAVAAQATVFVWHQVFGPSRDVSLDFYSRAFGWETLDYPMGEAGSYKMLVADGVPIAGAVGTEGCQDGQDIPPHWSVSIGVDDVDESVERCESLGGKLLSGPMDIPTVGRTALIRDPQGATFWVFHPEDC